MNTIQTSEFQQHNDYLKSKFLEFDDEDFTKTLYEPADYNEEEKDLRARIGDDEVDVLVEVIYATNHINSNNAEGIKLLEIKLENLNKVRESEIEKHNATLDDDNKKIQEENKEIDEFNKTAKQTDKKQRLSLKVSQVQPKKHKAEDLIKTLKTLEKERQEKVAKKNLGFGSTTASQQQRRDTNNNALQNYLMSKYSKGLHKKHGKLAKNFNSYSNNNGTKYQRFVKNHWKYISHLYGSEDPIINESMFSSVEDLWIHKLVMYHLANKRPISLCLKYSRDYMLADIMRTEEKSKLIGE